MNVELPVHGGDVARVAARYGGDDWLDFSANIVAGPPPDAVLSALRHGAGDSASLAAYPTASERALREALARSCGVAPAAVVIANGASALIEAFVRTVAPRRTVVPQPAFSEYARALAAAGSTVVPFELAPADGFALDVAQLREVLARERPDALILTNPHNPSGACATRAALGEVIAAASALGIALLIDEAFVDFVPEVSVVPDVRAGQVCVVRSLTKVYAMPALRVGYGIAPADFARALTARIPSWPVTSLAADAACAALGDPEYLARARSSVVRCRAELAAALRQLGLHVFESAANFLLWTSPLPAAEVAQRLAAEHRIVVRDCSSYVGLAQGGYVRVGVRTREENARLVAALRAVLARA